MLLLLLVIFAESTLSQQQTMGRDKPFRRVKACNGSNVCAIDTPSVGFTIVEDPRGKRPLPPGMRCLTVCKAEPRCIKTNFKDDGNQCELFYFLPKNYECRQNCQHYEVRENYNYSDIGLCTGRWSSQLFIFVLLN